MAWATWLEIAQIMELATGESVRHQRMVLGLGGRHRVRHPGVPERLLAHISAQWELPVSVLEGDPEAARRAACAVARRRLQAFLDREIPGGVASPD